MTPRFGRGRRRRRTPFLFHRRPRRCRGTGEPRTRPLRDTELVILLSAEAGDGQSRSRGSPQNLTGVRPRHRRGRTFGRMRAFRPRSRGNRRLVRIGARRKPPPDRGNRGAFGIAHGKMRNRFSPSRRRRPRSREGSVNPGLLSRESRRCGRNLKKTAAGLGGSVRKRTAGQLRRKIPNRRRRSRFLRRRRTGTGETRSRNRRGRMTQRSSRRRARVLKNPSLPGVRRNTPARLGFRNPHAREGPFHRVKSGRRPVFERPPVRCGTSVSERGEPALMRSERPPRRNHPRQPRHAFFGRTPRISALPAGRVAPATRRRRSTGFEGAMKPHVPREVPTSRGVEPLSVRIRGRP